MSKVGSAVIAAVLIATAAGAATDDVQALVASLTHRFHELEAKPIAEREPSAYVWLRSDIDAGVRVIDRLLDEQTVTPAVARPAREHLIMLSKQVDTATERATRYRWIASQGWIEAITEAVFARRIAVGMTSAQVIAAWNNPQQINETVAADGWREQWVYPDAVVYFRGDRVTDIRQRHSIAGDAPR